MTKDELFEMFDRYDAYETLETGETVQVIHWHDLKHIAEEIVKNCSIPYVSNCGGGIPYDNLSDSFKKSIDSIEDNLNK